jgi:hypothetical protein
MIVLLIHRLCKANEGFIKPLLAFLLTNGIFNQLGVCGQGQAVENGFKSCQQPKR